jgi:phosphate uptake regulator
MKRKLVRQGTSTLMISLPSKWVKSNGLDKGSEVDIGTENNKIIISPGLIENKKELQLKIETSEETLIRTLLTNAYRMDYNRIKIEFKNEDQLREISKIIKEYLLGFEIVSRVNNTCVIENITEPSSTQTESIFMKLLFNISGLIEGTEKLMAGDKNSEYLTEIESNIQRYDNFCRRIATKQNSNEEPTQLLWTFYAELVHGQREIFMLTKFVSEQKNLQISKEIREYFKELKYMYGLLREGYIKKDIKKLEEIHDMEKTMIYVKGYNLLVNKKGKENVILYRIMSAARNFYLASSPLIGLLLWKDLKA